MSVHAILNHFLGEELPRSVEIFAPELVLCATILAMLFLRMFEWHRRLPACWIALAGSLLTFFGVFAQFLYLKTGAVEGTGLAGLYGLWGLSESGVGQVGAYFTGLLVHDHFAVFFRLGLSLFLVLVVALTVLSGIPDEEDGQDFYTLLFGSMVGMMMATGANHLLMLFLSIEMMSVPSFAMVAFQKGRRLSGEAGFKFAVYGAGSAGVMLYGLSLLAGLLGTTSMAEFGPRIAVLLSGESFSLTNATVLTLVLAIMLILVGISFKLSLVPFHFWCPDAFEGASAEVAGYLSVATKVAVFGLLVRFVLSFHGTAEVLRELSMFFGIALGVISVLTMTVGNLAAYTQDNLKRMLAYSTIAHAGYMVMAVSALLVILNAPAGSGLTQADAVGCLEGLMYYLAVYLFMNLAAFAVVALVRNETYREDVDGFNGLVSGNGTTMLLCVCMGVAFFSLVGLPPFGGFFAKMAIFFAAFKAGTAHWFLWFVLAAGGLNTVFSLFYYLRVLKAMFINEPAEDARPLRLRAEVGAYVALITLPILLLGASPYQYDLSATARYVAAFLFQ
jgi:NADH-quinone oxidoreductase subunit N